MLLTLPRPRPLNPLLANTLSQDTPAQEKAEQNYNERTLGQEAAAAPKTARVETPSGEAAAFGAQSKDARDTTAGQSDTRNPERVGLEKEKNTALEDVDNSEGSSAKLGEGPGPRPVEIVAKEYGGDAGRKRPDEGSSEAPREVGSEGTAATSKAQTENQPDPAQNEYVHATGFAADGGDFDATKPGAGREAERTLTPAPMLA